MRSRRRLPLALAALFLLHALPFLSRPTLIGGDEPHYALMAHSMAVDRDLDLEPDYAAVEAGSKAAGRRFAGRRLERHLVAYPRNQPGAELYFSHPLGLPALAAPLIATLQTVRPGAAPDVVLGLFGLALTFLALLAGVRLLQKLGLDAAEARLLGFALYFATPLWFYSRLFFTEAYAWSLAILSIDLVSRRRWVPAALLLGSIFLLKESNVLLVLPILAGIWYRFGIKRAALMSLGPLGGFGLWIAKNLAIYGSPLVTFQPFQLGDPVDGVLGLLADPSHGLLVFAPVLILALVAAAWRPIPRAGLVDLELMSLITFLTVFATSACWVMWWGGSCYGPRLLVPAIPALAVSLVIAWRRVRASPTGRAVFVVLTGVGFAVQWLAATAPFDAFWETPVTELAGRRPLMLVAGLVLGLGATALLTRAAGPGRRGNGELSP